MSTTFFPHPTDHNSVTELNHSFVSRLGFDQSVYNSGAVSLSDGGGRGVREGPRHVNYSVVVIVVILSVVFILSGFLHLLARCLGRRRRRLIAPRQHSPLVSALHGQLQHLFHLHDAGVEQAFISTLPVFAYGSIRGLKDSADCAVCLNEFADDDRLRLLPECKHAFHVDCIDTWLLSHSTCPLCRHSLLPDHPLPPPTVCEPQPSDHRDSESIIRVSNIHEPDREIEEVIEAELIDESDLDESTPSPVAPTIRVVDVHGTERVLRVELGKVAACRVMSSSQSATSTRKLSESGARSYSMGSYEYIVDPMSWELTPYPGRPQDWKPAHRSALSDSIPELVSTPRNDETLFWTSRGLFTPHSLSRVRSALLTPIMSSGNNSNAGSSPFPDHSSYSPSQGNDRWIDIDIERGEVIETSSTGLVLISKLPLDPPVDSTSSGHTSDLSAPSSPALEVVREEDQFDSSDDHVRASFKQSRSSSLGRIGPCSLSEGLFELATVRRSLSEKDRVDDSLACDGNVQGLVTSRKFSLNWLMGRDQRIVFSASSPTSGGPVQLAVV